MVPAETGTKLGRYQIRSKLGQGGALMAVDVSEEQGLKLGVPHKLFEFRSGNGLITVAPYSVSADGKRFLLNTLVDESGGAPLTIVLNWTADLKK